MSIDLNNASTFVVCEGCGAHGPVIEGEAGSSIEPAYKAAHRAGWQICREYEHGPRHTYCPDCQPKPQYQFIERRPDAKP